MNTANTERQAVREYSIHIWDVTCQECRIAFRLRGWDGHVHARVGVKAGRPFCGAEPSEVSGLPPETAHPQVLGDRITCPRCLEDLNEAIAQADEDSRNRWGEQECNGERSE